jgi:hypothetical protein
MGCLTSSQVAAIKAEIAKIDLQITAAETAYLSALGNSEIDEYRFDSGDGSQRAKRRSPKQIREEIEALQATRSRLQRKLDGTSNVNMNLRRRRGGYGRRTC